MVVNEKSSAPRGEKDYYTHSPNTQQLAFLGFLCIKPNKQTKQRQSHSPNTQQLASFLILPKKYVQVEILHIKFCDLSTVIKDILKTVI